MENTTGTQQQETAPKKKRFAPRPWADITADIEKGVELKTMRSGDLMTISGHHQIPHTVRYSAKILWEQRIAEAPLGNLIAFLETYELDQAIYWNIHAEIEKRAGNKQASIRAQVTGSKSQLMPADPIASLFKIRIFFQNEGYVKPYEAKPVYSRDYKAEREKFADTDFITANLAKFGPQFLEQFNGYRLSIASWQKYMRDGKVAACNIYLNTIKEPVQTVNGMMMLGKQVFEYKAPR